MLTEADILLDEARYEQNFLEKADPAISDKYHVSCYSHVQII